jgi:hypothetical protein
MDLQNPSKILVSIANKIFDLSAIIVLILFWLPISLLILAAKYPSTDTALLKSLSTFIVIGVVEISFIIAGALYAIFYSASFMFTYYILAFYVITGFFWWTEVIDNHHTENG